MVIDIILNVEMLSVFMLNVLMPSVIMLYHVAIQTERRSFFYYMAYFPTIVIEQHIFDTNTGKQLSSVPIDVLLTLLLKKGTTF